ncbi:MAG TPA: (2Fe-2S) ferredoxin domain-containing protein [Thermomicrobiales bacterium]|nr:(2Fe-2S) ferredoxin domain-containing protein [Thermomicrobiales bacterium]
MYWTQKHVLVCTSSHCTQKGAMDVVGRLRLDVVRKGLDTQILVNNCGTIDLCDIGPNMVVYPDNIIYRGVTVKDLPEILEYLKGGPVVERLLVGPNSPEELQRKAFYARLLDSPSPLSVAEGDALATETGLADGFVAEQLRRGFMAKKPDEEGIEHVSATKKARARYSL